MFKMFQFHSIMSRLFAFLLCIALANADYLVDSASFAQGKGYVSIYVHLEIPYLTTASNTG